MAEASQQPKAARRAKLGEILLQAGVVSADVLEKALSEQRRSRVKLGRFLVERGIVSEEQILRAVSRQLGIDIFSPERHTVQQGIASLIPEALAFRLKIAPLHRKGNILYVALQDPTDLDVLDRLMHFTRLDVEPVLCREKDLNILLQSMYVKGQQVPVDFEEFDEIESISIVTSKDEPQAEESAGYQIDASEQAPIVRLANAILVKAVKKGASDVHLSLDKDKVRLRFRVDGRLQDIAAPPRSIFSMLVSRFKILGKLDIAMTRVPQDGRFTFSIKRKEYVVRVSTLPAVHGEKVVLRLLDSSPRSLSMDALGLSDKDVSWIRSAMDKPFGMILSTGPTGSGKTTFLYSLLQGLDTETTNVITLEDPVEYSLRGITQVQVNAKSGLTFASGLRSILRQDPDVILVGEIRDKETAVIAIESALTGHKVLSTLHTNDAVGTVTRLLEMGIEPFLIASTLNVVVAQRLVRRLCPSCRAPHQLPEEDLGSLGLEGADGSRIAGPKGCKECNGTGYKGRIGIFEMLHVTREVQSLIIRKAPPDELRSRAIEAGQLKVLLRDARDKLLAGEISLEDYLQFLLT